jgi:hypothetical protein
LNIKLRQIDDGQNEVSERNDIDDGANAGLIFLTDELTNDRYLVDTGATLSIVPCNQNSSPSGPLLKGADGQPIPSWGFIKKTVQFQGKLFTSTFLQAAVAGPILGIDF